MGADLVGFADTHDPGGSRWVPRQKWLFLKNSSERDSKPSGSICRRCFLRQKCQLCKTEGGITICTIVCTCTPSTGVTTAALPTATHSSLFPKNGRQTRLFLIYGGRFGRVRAHTWPGGYTVGPQTKMALFKEFYYPRQQTLRKHLQKMCLETKMSVVNHRWAE